VSFIKFSMPRDYGRRFHDIQNIGPARPHHPQHDPKEPVKAAQHRSPTFSLQHRDLLAQGEHLQRELKATPKENREGGENGANDLDHKSALACRGVVLGYRVFAWQIIHFTSSWTFGYTQVFMYDSDWLTIKSYLLRLKL
jgi:hypothetical protein